MKFKLLFIIPFVLITTSAFAQNWEFITESKSGSKWYLKTGTSNSLGYKKAWTKQVSSKISFKDETGKTVVINGFCVDLQLYDCATRKTKTQSIAYYNSNGEVVKLISFKENESQWLDVLPDSIGEMIFNKVCK